MAVFYSYGTLAFNLFDNFIKVNRNHSYFMFYMFL